MRPSRQLGERRANATMVSRLLAKPSGHWEKLSRRAIFPNVPWLRDSCELRNDLLSAKIKIIAKSELEFTTKLAIARNRCYAQFFIFSPLTLLLLIYNMRPALNKKSAQKQKPRLQTTASRKPLFQRKTVRFKYR